MPRSQFTVTDYPGLHARGFEMFPSAVEQAVEYASVGGNPATVTDRHGCRWVVYAGGQVELKECPSTSPCECAEAWSE